MATGMKVHGIKKQLIWALLAAAVTIAACFLTYVLDVPNPVIILATLMIFFAATVSNIAGAVSAVCIIIYAFFFFSEHHNFLTFNSVGIYKCRIIVLSIFAMYLIVAVIRKKRDDAFEKIVELNHKLKEQNKILEKESDHDALTGIYNRRGGNKKSDELMEVAHEPINSDYCAIAAIMDVDNFKYINDTYGHAAGDRTLKHFARSMEEAFPEYGVPVRIGGDEFQLYFFGKDLQDMEKRVREFSGSTFQLESDGCRIEYHISCGYAVYPYQSDSKEELIHMADAALYEVKTNGKHQALRYNGDSCNNNLHGSIHFSLRSVSENLPISFMVYRADESEKILVVSNTLLELCECKNITEFRDYTGGTFRGFVHPDDVEMVEKCIREQIRVNSRNLDSVDYRIRTRKGRILHLHDLGRRVHDERMGDLFYVVVYDRNSSEPDAVGSE